MEYYTGIGSRSTPDSALKLIERMALSLAEDGFCLRSGNAEGADTAFYVGHSKSSSKYEIYLPWPNFGKIKCTSFISLDTIDPDVVQKAQDIAESMHPAWHNCSQGARLLHTRNVFQILGKDLETPSNTVICWTPGGDLVGGTATALRLAEKYNIPICNLGYVI